MVVLVCDELYWVDDMVLMRTLRLHAGPRAPGVPSFVHELEAVAVEVGHVGTKKGNKADGMEGGRWKGPRWDINLRQCREQKVARTGPRPRSQRDLEREDD